MTTFDRKPLHGGCNTPTAGPPAVIGDPCAHLADLRAALYSLMTGRQTHEVRFGDQWQVFHQGSVVALRAEVMRLERICPRGPSNPYGGRNTALRAGPYEAAPKRPNPIFYSRPRYW
jgi:hypothetical protein